MITECDYLAAVQLSSGGGEATCLLLAGRRTVCSVVAIACELSHLEAELLDEAGEFQRKAKEETTSAHPVSDGAFTHVASCNPRFCI